MFLGLILLILANVMLSIIPIFLKDISNYSMFAITFVRFLIAFLFELFILFYLIKKERDEVSLIARDRIRERQGKGLADKKRLKKHEGSLLEDRRGLNDIEEAIANLRYKDLLKHYFKTLLFARNPYFDSLNQFSFYSILGIILISISIPTYFFSFEILGVIITTITVAAITLFWITLRNIIKKEEEADMLKIVYIILLLTSIFTASFGQSGLDSADSNYSLFIDHSFEGIVNLIISMITWIYFLILTGRSTNHPILKPIKIRLDNGKIKFSKSSKENKSGPSPQAISRSNLDENNFAFVLESFLKQHKSKYFSVNRSLLQLTISHMVGTFMLYVVTILFYLVDPGGLFGVETYSFLSMSANDIFELMVNPNMIIIAIICTGIPYLIVFFSAATWPKTALKHDQWNSILSLTEPLFGLYIGFYIWHENIRIDYMVLTTILLFSSVVIRYFYESHNRYDFYIFLKISEEHI
ncbi:MAG: hypothetical protein ACTSVC_10610, partial [Promethearchaeota archaeon]